jgi:serine/threonine protein kinase
MMRQGDLYLVFESMDVDLKGLRNRLIAEGRGLSGADIRSIAYQILNGAKYMHSANIVHRDLKFSNILVSTGLEGGYETKIADLGLSRVILPDGREGVEEGKDGGGGTAEAATADGDDGGDAMGEDDSDTSPMSIDSETLSALARETDPLEIDRVYSDAPFYPLAQQLTVHVVTRWYRAPGK